MSLKFKIASGPLQGREFPLIPGVIIGRSAADISLNDPKVSGRHAKIEAQSDGGLVLIDLGSNNGLRVQDKKYSKITLKPGLIVQIGSTLCEVFSDGNSKPPPVTSEIPPKPIEWPEYFTEFIQRAMHKIKSRPEKVAPFYPAVVLTITNGLQSGTRWVLGYGPRSVGAESLDLILIDSKLPAQAFVVRAIGKQAVFETDLPGKVRLNEHSVSSEKLQDGDIISVLNTRIIVSFHK